MKIVSHPTIYEVQTRLLGRARLDARLLPVSTMVAANVSTGTLVDVGGGTARSREMWPDAWTYYSIDPDERVLDLKDTSKRIERLVGSADSLPLPDKSADVVLMQSVSHHLNDQIWAKALDEVNRVLKPTGYFIFCDAYWSRRRVFSRLMWKLDAGRFPRPRHDLENMISSRFTVGNIDHFTLVHHVILITARPSS